MRHPPGRGGPCEEIAESIEPKNIQFSAELSGMVDLFDRNSGDALDESGRHTALSCVVNAADAIMNTSPPSLRRNPFGKKPRQPPL
jgi:hypothetical protein